MKIEKRKQLAKEFAKLVQDGINAWAKAGEIVARGIDEFIDSICEEYPEFTPEIVRRFEQMGRKVVHPRLFVSDAPGFRRLRKLSYEIQEKTLTNGVELLVKKQSGYDTIKADVLSLTPDQAKQVIAHDHIRTAGEQRLHIESELTFKAAPIVDLDEPYRITGRRVTIKRDVTLTAKDLAKILAEMES